MTAHYDIAIAGGGLAGSSLALALSGHGLRIALIEAAALQRDAQPNYDDRAIALSYGSRRIFEGLGLWPELSPLATAIEHIHVSDRGHFGATRLTATAENVPALGYVVLARELGQTLNRHVSALTDIDIFSPAVLVQADRRPDAVLLRLDQEGRSIELSTTLLVAADGGDSRVRDQLGVTLTQRDYGQTAIIANVTPERAHCHVAYERFTEHGPLALLPMTEGRCALVWTETRDQVDEVMALDDAAFLDRLHSEFPRLGRFVRAGRRHAYPLRLVAVDKPPQDRAVLIGNAAHTLHPIAGQGFNLGLRDVAALTQVLLDAHRAGEDMGSMAAVRRYTEWRRRDQRNAITLTDTLVTVFSNHFAPLVAARSLGLVALDLFPPLKHLLARHTMGLAGKLPRLARGLQP